MKVCYHCKTNRKSSSGTVTCPHSPVPPSSGKSQWVCKILQVEPVAQSHSKHVETAPIYGGRYRFKNHKNAFQALASQDFYKRHCCRRAAAKDKGIKSFPGCTPSVRDHDTITGIIMVTIAVLLRKALSEWKAMVSDVSDSCRVFHTHALEMPMPRDNNGRMWLNNKQELRNMQLKSLW